MRNSFLTKYFGEFLIIICALLWGTISLFTLPLNEYGYNSFQITFLRSILASIFLAIFIFIYNKNLFKISIKDIPLFIGLGTISFCFCCTMYTLSIELNGSAVAAMLMYTSPIWTVVISLFLFNEKINLTKILSLIGVLFGCALISFVGEISLTFKGILVGLLTGVLLAMYSIFGKIVNKKYNSYTVTFYAFLFSALGAFFLSKGWEVPKIIIDNPKGIIYIIGLALLPTTVSYILYNIGLKTVPAGKASMLSTIEIVVATLVGVIFYHRNPGLIGYLGIFITILSLIFMELFENKIDKNTCPKTT